MPNTSSGPTAPSTGVLRPLGLDEVRITGGFWADRQATNGSATLSHIRYWLEREGWLGNFDLAAAGTLPAGRRGREFSDSEVYKYLEATAWEIGRTGDAALEQSFAGVVARVSAAQEGDGYLNTRFGRQGQDPRWSDLEWGHELYCLGHLFQAAVARVRTGHADDQLVTVARRAADLICDVFGESGIQSVCGHAEVETGLAELARALDEPRYLELARLFIERRGTGTLADIEWGRPYYQDDVPVRSATVLRGHAVRANYLSAGAVDVAVETGDSSLLDVLATQWANTVARRTYVTGGQGSHHQGESFGDDWVLPPDRAYSETCAAVGSIQFSWRLLLARGLPEYADLIERSLYNVVATSPSTEGTSFFYANTLHRREPASAVSLDEVSLRPASSLRAPWFEVSCCPPNVARTFASLAGYVATADDDGVQLHQYAPSTIRTVLSDGRSVELAVSTDYPVSGSIQVAVVSGDSFTLTLRVPSWAGGALLDGVPVEPGSVSRTVRAGETVTLELPMEARVTRPDPRIDAVRGTVAIERGPEVLCLESSDLPSGVALADLSLTGLLTEQDGRVWVQLVDSSLPDRPWPYSGAADATPQGDLRAPLVAYHDWANRGPSTMRIWIPEISAG